MRHSFSVKVNLLALLKVAAFIYIILINSIKQLINTVISLVRLAGYLVTIANSLTPNNTEYRICE